MTNHWGGRVSSQTLVLKWQSQKLPLSHEGIWLDMWTLKGHGMITYMTNYGTQSQSSISCPSCPLEFWPQRYIKSPTTDIVSHPTLARQKLAKLTLAPSITHINGSHPKCLETLHPTNYTCKHSKLIRLTSWCDLSITLPWQLGNQLGEPFAILSSVIVISRKKWIQFVISIRYLGEGKRTERGDWQFFPDPCLDFN